jgi:hypothetical protein
MWVSKASKLGCLGAVVAVLGLGADANAASITFNLDCVLNTTPCAPTSSFGTVTLTDGSGANTGKVEVAVNLAGTGQKFKDMLLNFTGPETSFTSSDGQTILYGSNAYAINPYNGLFDLSGMGGLGWNGDDPYSTFLGSPQGAISVADFIAKDSSGGQGVYVAMHIQNIGDANGGNCTGNSTGTNCVPGMTGPGSLKIGGRLTETPPPSVPEPTSMVLLGTGLLAGAWRAKRRVR